MLRRPCRFPRFRPPVRSVLACSLSISLSMVFASDLQSVPAGAEPMTLFTFVAASEAEWRVVSVGVMGGRSQGFVSVEDGTLRFAGTLVTRGGGFTSIRARREADLSGYDGFEMRVRGGGRPFELAVDDGTRGYGRTVSRRASFPTGDDWTVVRIPFETLRSTIFGRAVNAPALDQARVRGVGIFMADGQDGPFRLEIDWIRAYSEAGTRPPE